MFPEHDSGVRRHPEGWRRQPASAAIKQRGFLIPLSLFILVVMGALALVIARNAEQSASGFTQELLSVQAFYAAESGAQRGLQSLFFPDGKDRLGADARCLALASTINFSAISGLQLCSAQLSCSCRYRDGSNCDPGTGANYLASASLGKASSYYTITSVGRCGSNSFLAERSIQTGAYLNQP